MRRWLHFLTIALSLALGSPASAAPARSPTAKAGKLSAYSQFLKIMQGPRAPRNTLELLPRLSLELRSNFTFVYETRSPHDDAVDALYPRLVLFTLDGRLTLAMTGDPARPGYDVIEAIHFDDAKAAFATSRFVLPDAANREPSLAAEVPHNGALNRPECLRCHGADPRPIFDSYNVWPGFYGSLGDQPALNPPEMAKYTEFLKTQKPRADLPYGLLAWPGKKFSSVPPYMDSDGKTVHSLESMEQLRKLPNTRLGMALTELNRARLQRKLKQSPKYARLRYGLLQGLAGCGQLPIPAEFQERLHLLGQRESDEKLLRSDADPRSEIGSHLSMQELEPSNEPNMSEIVYMAGALGLSRSDWSMTFEPNSLSYFDGILSSDVGGDRSYYIKEDFVSEMLRDLAQEDRAFRRFYKTYAALAEIRYPFGKRLELSIVDGDSKLCELLAARATQAGTRPEDFPVAKLEWLDGSPFGNAVEPTGAGPRAAAPPSPFRKCVQCHDPAYSPPPGLAIPFGDLQKLAAQPAPLLRKIAERIEPGARRRMPLGPTPLSESERGAIREWVGKATAQAK